MMHYKKLTGVGIVGYGAYVPRLRISVSEIASAHQVDGEQISKGLLVTEKSVANWDEDTVTMATMAAYRALAMAGVDPTAIGAVYVGSESHPYAVKPTSTIVGEALGIGTEYMAADLEFACKAGTAGMQIAAAELASGVISYGLVIAADRAQARPGDVLEYTAAAGAAAFVFGRRRLLARLLGFLSVSSDTGDFWRRSGERYPQHTGRFTGEPAYFRHVETVARQFFSSSKTAPSDYDVVVFHMPNGKYPRRAAKALGFSPNQYEAGMIVGWLGNPYSASSLLGFVEVLDQVGPGKRILVVSYGSGAGADALAFQTTTLLGRRRGGLRKVRQGAVQRVNYGTYRVLEDIRFS